MGVLPRGLACHLLRDASTLPQPCSLHVIEAEDPVGMLDHGFQVPVQYGGVQEDGRFPGGLLHVLGNMARHIPGPFIEQGVVLHYPDGVVVLIQDSPELNGGEGSPHNQLDRAAVQPGEDARADAGDKEGPELLQVGVAVQGPGQHLLAGDEGSRETAGRSWISMI